MTHEGPTDADAGVTKEEPTTRRRGLSWRLSTRKDRLDLAIDAFDRELATLRSRPGPKGQADQVPWWRPGADSLLELARSLRDERRIDSAWDALNASKRISLRELSQDELDHHVQVLMAEVDSKLQGWRKVAATAAVKRDENTPYTPEAVASAQRMMDEESTNIYIKVKIAGRRLLIAAILLAVTISSLWVATGLGWFDGIPVDSDSEFVLHDGGLFGGVMLLGVFGAMLSLALDLSHSSPTRSRIYDLTTTQIAAPLARISIGAGSAVLTVSAAQAALVGGGTPWLYLAAIPAGFSERLVRRSVENLETSTVGGR